MGDRKNGKASKTSNDGVSIEALRFAVIAGKIEWNRHALERMAERNIGRDEILDVFQLGERIENYPDARPLPSALFLGYSGKRPLHVVVAFNEELKKVFVITVYEPDAKHFGSDFKTRKKQ